MRESLSLRLRTKRLQMIALRSVRKLLGLEKTIYVDERVSEYRTYWQEASRLIGAELHPLSDEFWEVRRGGRHTRIHIHNVQLNDSVVGALSSDKALCYRLAQEQGVPVPRHAIFRLSRIQRAAEFLKQHPGTYVVKPARNASAGRGVTTHVHTEKKLEKAALLASVYGEEFLLEEMIAGESCRLLFLEDKFLHGVRRRGVRVTGDGRSGIPELLQRQGFKNVTLDANAVLTLRAQGLGAESVPESGREILVRSLPAGEASIRELRTVYNEAITEQLCPAIIEEVGRVVRAVESRLAGADVLTCDPRKSLRESGGVFLEVNPGPGIHHHYVTPEDQRSHPVAVRILESLLREER
ncbi:MAG: hypothetical protein HY237_03920 [Acidobacteria bacterium]|nr:hypothetical protein [Acidobacteriota bacterium]